MPSVRQRTQNIYLEGQIGDLLSLIQQRWSACQRRMKVGAALSEWGFHRSGRPIVDFRDAWAEACQTAMVPGLLFHDLRRSAVRNMERSGAVTQAVAMKITGHRTDRVDRRYRIIDAADIERALEKTQESIKHTPARNVTGTKRIRQQNRRWISRTARRKYAKKWCALEDSNL